MSPLQKKDGARWLSLLNEGTRVVLVGSETKWIVFECESKERAEHVVKELKEWAWASIYHAPEFTE